MRVALSTAENGERVHPALFAFGFVFLDRDSDVVGDEADGEGVEEGFQEGEAAGDDAVVGVDYGD